MYPVRWPSNAFDGDRTSESDTMDSFRIIIVEDELITALDIARQLRRIGY
jgi:hypothetical protein